MVEPPSASPTSSISSRAWLNSLALRFSPAAVDLILRGKATEAGRAATLVRLAGAGYLEFVEKPDHNHGLRLRTPAKTSEESLSIQDRALLAGLRLWSRGRGETPSWNDWTAALRRQTELEGSLNREDWRAIKRWPHWAARFLLPAEKIQAARQAADRLKRYPDADDMPQTRQEWDEALAYAVAAGQAEPFLERAREACEYFARHLQGVVMTFYTPAWYVPRRMEGEERFAFLTTGMARLLSRLRWDRLEPLS